MKETPWFSPIGLYLGILLILALIFIPVCCKAQKLVRKGNQIEAISIKEKKAPEKTIYTYKDTDGIIYPVYVSSKGTFFIIKKSKRTGKEYRKYLPELKKMLK